MPKKTTAAKYDEFIYSIEDIPVHPKMSFGPLSLNLCFNRGGKIARGYIHLFYGKQSAGKTTTTLEIHKQFYRDYPEGKQLYIDLEASIQPTDMRRVGVGNWLQVAQPPYLEQALEIAREYLLNRRYDLVTIDSLGAATAEVMADEDYSPNAMRGVSARYLTQFVKDVRMRVFHNGGTLIFLDQARANQGQGPAEIKPSSGQAVAHAAGTVLKFSRVSTDHPGMITTKVVVEKDKVTGAIGSNCQYSIDADSGVRGDLDIIDVAKNFGLVRVSGSWYTYTDGNGVELKGQGEEGAAKKFPLAEIEARIWNAKTTGEVS